MTRFVYSPIDKYREERRVREERIKIENPIIEIQGIVKEEYEVIPIVEVQGIVDTKSFLFTTFNTNELSVYHLKESEKDKSIFFLYHNDDQRLFAFGNSEIRIGKNEFFSVCNQSDDSLYNYNDKQKVLCGQIGLNERFFIQRLIVVQFEEEE